MAVETQNSSSSLSNLPHPAHKAEEAEKVEERIENHYVACPACKAQVILLPRTIQTFCYYCGEPVTRPDKADMYYE